MPLDAVRLPRHAVLEILHEAQTATTGAIQGLLLRGAGGKLELFPVPLDAASKDVVGGLAAHGCEVLAFYRSSTRGAGDPSEAEKLKWLSLAPLYLSVSLGIRGVLQLRGWRRDRDRIGEVDLELGDDSPGP